MNLPPPRLPGSTTPPMPAATPVPPPPPGYAARQPLQYSSQQFAGFWSRFLGYVLDGFLYGLLMAVFVIPGSVLIANALDDCRFIDRVDGTTELVCDDGQVQGGLLAGGIALMVVGAIIVAILYLRALGRTGQTWGRRIAGVKVVRQDDGQPIGVGKALGRQLFAGLVSAQIIYLGYLWMLWDDRNQTWHDKIIGSVVVKA